MVVRDHEHWPLDFDLLEPGDVIPREVIERAYGVRWQDDPKLFHFAKMRLRKRIEDERPGFPWVLVGEDRLTILNHEAAAKHLAAQHETAMRREKKVAIAIGKIDRSQVDPDEYEEALRVQRRALLVVDQDRRQKRLNKLIEGGHGAIAENRNDRCHAAVDAQRANGQSDERDRTGDPIDFQKAQ